MSVRFLIFIVILLAVVLDLVNDGPERFRISGGSFELILRRMP